ncbi:MAG: SpaH/EbpB family LPXTG-anchored major pilin [Faecousia sp.]
MKTTKKVLAFLIVAMMIVAMLPNALASEAGTQSSTYKITISNAQAGHTYTAYQIFSGDLSLSGATKILSNIVFGSGVSEAGKTALLNFDGGPYTDAAALAKALTEGNVDAFAKLAATADNLGSAAKYVNQTTAGNCVIDGLDPGYYLVIDSYTDAEGDKSDALSNYMVQVVGDAAVTSKHSYPTLDKKIKHNESDKWEVVGDNQIGDTVYFRTITTVPDTTGYTVYDYIINDTMSDGLTSNVQANNTNGDVSIKVNDTTDLAANYFTVAVDGSNSNKFTVTVDILGAVEAGVIKADDELVTYYSGVLNEEAKIYDVGKQDNVAYLDYSNNPNDTTSKGKTPDVVVYDWTFKMGVNKVNESGDPLTGAKFVLSEASGLEVADMECNDEGVPATTTDLIKLVKVDNGTYRIATDSDETTTYVIEAGSVVIKGLDDATDYYLYETKAPEGYNLMSDPVHFKISVDYSQDGSAVAYGTPTVTVGTGASSTTLSTNVVNKAGASLPSTGGIGTTIFYVIGSVLVIGAVVLLVSKKRMNAID